MKPPPGRGVLHGPAAHARAYGQAETPLALYDLETDPGETANLADKHPDVVERLRKLADQARADLGDSAAKQTGKGVCEAGRVEGKEKNYQLGSTFFDW